MKKLLPLTFPVLLIALLSHVGSAYSAKEPKVAIRDSQTGKAVEAQIHTWVLPDAMASSSHRQALKRGIQPQQFPNWPSASNRQIMHSSQGFVPWRDSKHWRLWRVSATGYATLPVLIAPGGSVPLKTIWLDPLPTQSGNKKTPDRNAAHCQTGQVCGYVLDSTTHQPLANAQVTVRSNRTELSTRTLADGSFRVSIAPLAGRPASQEVEIQVGSSGYVQQIWEHVDSRSGVQLIIDLRPGQGIDKRSLKHPLAEVPQGHIPESWLKAKLSQTASLPAKSTKPVHTIRNPEKNRPLAPNERPGGAIFMDPPDSIAVGFAADGGYCCGNNCASSQVFSLETYVQKGLDNEWISSWPADSLKAGSVPFRSYGAWHAIESPYTGYDICAGPCCQAFELTSYASTVNAASATRGILLELNGALARSEYSAENNAWNDPNDGLSCTNTDLSCGDGFVGSPLNGWPCLADNSVGRGCFGHGRGMSQWGTYYHALDGENWAAIVDHYYNALGNPGGNRSQYPTTPVALLSFAAWPQTLNAGTDFSIALSLDNRAGEANGAASFGPVLIGASLLNSSNDYSDPANDNAIMLSAFGQQNTGRPFHTDPAWPPGLYDLAVALWLDVDANGTITGDDWVLAFDIQPNAVTLLAPDDLIFADGF